MFASENGDVYVWGSNSDRQLGLNSLDADLVNVSVPTIVPITLPVVYVSCGHIHTAFVTSKYSNSYLASNKIFLYILLRACYTYNKTINWNNNSLCAFVILYLLVKHCIFFKLFNMICKEKLLFMYKYRFFTNCILLLLLFIII